MPGEFFTVDTHALWWYLRGDSKLSSRARQALREAEQGKNLVLVPTLALGEILNLIRKQQNVQAQPTLQERFAEVLLWLDNRIENFEVIPLTRKILERATFFASELEAHFRKMGTPKIKDMRDLVFMATADLKGCALVTRDGDIRKCGLVPCLW